MRTTINISDGILSELRERARHRRRPLREILEETIQRGLSASPPSSVKRVSIQTHRVGIKPAYQGVSMNQLYDQIEAEDAGKRSSFLMRIKICGDHIADCSAARWVSSYVV